MAYDGIFFKSLVKEFRDNLLERRIEKINQHSDKIISISFSRLKKTRLHISIASDAPFLAFSKDKLPNPEQAPMFCMLLRKHLQGGIIKDIKQLQSDRIIQFELISLNEMKDAEKKYLIAEIMGRHSNLILVDHQRNVIDSLKHVNPLMSKRPMGPGYVYSVPFEEKTNIETIDKNIINKIKNNEGKITSYLLKEIGGFSKHVSSEILYKARIDQDKLSQDLSETELDSIYRELLRLQDEVKNNTAPHAYQNTKGKIEISNIHLSHLKDFGYQEIALPSYKIEDGEDFIYSSLVFDFFDKKGKNDILIQKIASITALIHQIIDKENKRIKNLEKDIKQAEKHDKYKLYGELCMANFHLMEKGMKTVRVLNYYDNTEIDIPLKYDKTPSENAESFFKRYQKMKKTLLYADEQILIAKDKIEHLESVISSLEQTEDIEDFNAIQSELIAESIIKEKLGQGKRKKADKKLPPREFTSPNGFTVKVGRNNLQNDELTLKTASKNHIWLHTKIIPSSHVILCGKFEEVEDEDILFAASICAKYSKAKHSENVPIDLTEVKHVSKTKGAKPGKVIYVDYKTVYVNPFQDEA